MPLKCLSEVTAPPVARIKCTARLLPAHTLCVYHCLLSSAVVSYITLPVPCLAARLPPIFRSASDCLFVAPIGLFCLLLQNFAGYWIRQISGFDLCLP